MSISDTRNKSELGHRDLVVVNKDSITIFEEGSSTIKSPSRLDTSMPSLTVSKKPTVHEFQSTHFEGFKEELVEVP